MSRAQRIKVLVELAEQDVDKAQLTLKEIRANRTFTEQQLSDLKNYRNEYMARLTTSGQMLPIQLQTTQAFINKLNLAIEGQQTQLKSIEAMLEQAQQQWTEKRMRLQALDKVYQNLLRKEYQQTERAEQKMLDELASQNFKR
ncbi:flagellar export protein FliJ [Thiomicrospira microaerophila]|uniref:flagellar export protein FliJ n=1 Tax=Thiomicrospira microaerophila TaxID=406020 RepID=UPI00200F5D0C|nr:flagellar export protein FliJ [Thiomicrospira microaerophila]UQB41685.1 flagellar export protein FliJ [Thiomicrospira microaerophila]